MEAHYHRKAINILTFIVYISLCSSASAQMSASEDYIIKISGITTDAQIYGLSATQKQTTVTYYDGLGRTLQKVNQNASPLQNDIILPMAYDNLGRQTVDYLPYAGKATDQAGTFRSNALGSDQAAFYSNSTQYIVPVDGSPYSQTLYENSPLGRQLSEGMAGAGYQPIGSSLTGGSGTQHFKTVAYRANSSSDGNILVWNSNGTFTTGTYYAANSLRVTDGKDEDGTETLIFTNNAGQAILKRQILTGGNFDTYYIYNLAGMISYVIPPGAIAQMASSNFYSLTQAGVNKMIFHYVYDSMGRVIQRTIPAKGTVSIIYDPVNRPVLMQDSNMRANHQWNYIKYDAKGRAINQGIYTDNTNVTPTAMQGYVNGLAANYTTNWYESRTTVTSFNYYTNVVFPTTSFKPLSYLYYDDYDVNNNGSADYSYSTQGLTGEIGATSAPIKGMATISMQNIVGAGIASNVWLTKVLFYDKRGNTIQTKSSNHLYFQGALTVTDVSTTVPDFMGIPQIILVSKKTASTTTNSVQTNVTYDHMYRVKAVDQYYNGSATVNHIAVYGYNEIGKLITKSLGFVSGTSYLQNLDMRYNIRGQILSINNSKLNNDGGVTNSDSNDLFGTQYLYDYTDTNLGNVPYYSGKLSGVKWMTSNGSGGTSMERAFKYYYDNAGRDTAAIYAERASSSTSTFTTTHGWDEDRITYDQNGNIKTLYRNSATQGVGNHSAIDNLTYSYSSTNPNQLATVADASGSPLGFVNGTGIYYYDGNGNLTNEPYKGLSTISYNVLNKTDKIVFTTSANRYIDYSYDTNGNLLRKRQFDNVGGVATLQNTTDYVDGFTYVSSGAGSASLEYLAMPEGRIINSGGVFIPTYNICDQQGNARVEFDNTGSGNTVHLRQENSYYAFGLIMPGSTIPTPANDNKRLYNGGSEWQNDFNNLPDYYQTDKRNYDPALGRFIGVDPLAESGESLSSYQYAGNNPIMLNDPFGDVSDYSGYSPAQVQLLQESGGQGPHHSHYSNNMGDIFSSSNDLLAAAQGGDPSAIEAYGLAYGTTVYSAGAPVYAFSYVGSGVLSLNFSGNNYSGYSYETNLGNNGLEINNGTTTMNPVQMASLIMNDDRWAKGLTGKDIDDATSNPILSALFGSTETVKTGYEYSPVESIIGTFKLSTFTSISKSGGEHLISLNTNVSNNQNGTTRTGDVNINMFVYKFKVTSDIGTENEFGTDSWHVTLGLSWEKGLSVGGAVNGYGFDGSYRPNINGLILIGTAFLQPEALPAVYKMVTE